MGDGLVVYNLNSRKPEYYAVYKRQFSNVFKNIRCFQTEDINQMLVASEREIAAERTKEESWLHYMEDFQFPKMQFSVCFRKPVSQSIKKV